jgi:hypothetical protein
MNSEKPVPSSTMNILNTVRRIRACETETAALLVLEHLIAENRLDRPIRELLEWFHQRTQAPEMSGKDLAAEGWSQLGTALGEMHALLADVAAKVDRVEAKLMDKRVLPGIRSTLGNIYEYLLKLTERLDAIEAKVESLT